MKEKLDTTVGSYEKPVTIGSHDYQSFWCCDCGLRHFHVFEIIRGKTPSEDRIRMAIFRDDWATDAKKKIDQLEAKIKRLTKKKKRK